MILNKRTSPSPLHWDASISRNMTFTKSNGKSPFSVIKGSEIIDSVLVSVSSNNLFDAAADVGLRLVIAADGWTSGRSTSIVSASATSFGSIFMTVELGVCTEEDAPVAADGDDEIAEGWPPIICCCWPAFPLAVCWAWGGNSGRKLISHTAGIEIYFFKYYDKYN